VPISLIIGTDVMNSERSLTATSSSGTVAIPGAGLDTDLLPIYLLRFDRPHTRRSYTNDLAQFFGSEIVTLRMAREVTFVHVNEHIQRLQDAGYKPATIQRRVSGLRGFFDWLMALDLIERNPADRQLIRRVSRNNKGERAITVLTRAQARLLIEATDLHGEAAPRDRAMLLTMLNGALRRSEVAAINLEDIRQISGYWVLDLPVTKGGVDQIVKLPENVVEAINLCCEAYDIRSGAVWRSLASNYRGGRLGERSIYNVVIKAAAHAGLTDTVGAHTLRHTACTLAIEGGATPQQVQAHARHKKLETTMVYVHQRDRLRDNASDYIKL
jgi:site-specific recombinase XerD